MADYTFDIMEFMLACMAFLIVLLVAMYVVMKINTFLDKRRVIKLEINRTDGEEHRYWERELKKLYAESIPIVGIILKKRNKK